MLALTDQEDYVRLVTRSAPGVVLLSSGGKSAMVDVATLPLQLAFGRTHGLSADLTPSAGLLIIRDRQNDRYLIRAPDA
jgi:hypothetical protein